MSQYSDSHFQEDPNSSWYKVYSYIKPNSTVMDVGCSSGNFGEVLIKQKNCKVDGIELDDSDIKEAKTKLGKVYKLNVETNDLSVVKDKYDYIYFGDVIEHLVDPIATLKRIKILLKSNGCVVFSIPNMSHISVRLMLLNGDLIYGKTGLLDVTHLHFYTHNEVDRVFSSANYEITKLDPVLIDYPKELIQKELERVGLKVTKEFIEFASKTEASIYQFVGIATPSLTKNFKSKPLSNVSPVDLFQKYLDNTKKYYENIIKSQKEHIEKLNIELKRLSKINKEYGITLDDFKRSTIFRASIKLKTIRRKILK